MTSIRPGSRLWLALRFENLPLEVFALENIAHKPDSGDGGDVSV